MNLFNETMKSYAVEYNPGSKLFNVAKAGGVLGKNINGFLSDSPIDGWQVLCIFESRYSADKFVSEIKIRKQALKDRGLKFSPCPIIGFN